MPYAQRELMTRQTDEMTRGFTLIELMVTVAIVAILATIAYPLYVHQLVEGRRSAAEAALMDIAQREQQYFLDQRAYAYGADTASVSSALNVSIPSNVSDFYDVTVVADTTSPGFIAVATPIAGKAQASDVTLKINETGLKQPTDTW